MKALCQINSKPAVGQGVKLPSFKGESCCRSRVGGMGQGVKAPSGEGPVEKQ